MFAQGWSLLFACFGLFAAREPREFRLTIVAASVLAAVFWFVCSRYWRLWNLRYRMNAAHHILCGLAAVLTLLFAITFQALRFTAEAANISIEKWQSEIVTDQAWSDATFRLAWEKVHDLGLENFDGKPRPGEPDAVIPIGHAESMEAAATTYATSACTHFGARRPLLSKIVWARPALPSDVVKQDIETWQQGNRDPYPAGRAIKLVADQVRMGLGPQLPRLVQTSRILSVILFIVAQAIPFCVIGYAAYRDLKEQV